MNRYLVFILVLLGLTGLCYAIHQFILTHYEQDHWWIGTGYNLIGLYIFMGLASLAMMVILSLTDYAMPKQVGFVFLGGLTIKAVACYLYIKSGLGMLENDFVELNFVAVFFVYLFFDVFVAYKLVNQDDEI